MHNELRAPLVDAEGRVQGTLVVWVPPGQSSPMPPLLDLTHDPGRDPSLEPLQLVEGQEYLYELRSDSPLAGPVALDPVELFSPDRAGAPKGRLRPGLHTGMLVITACLDGRLLGRARFEVRSRKLDYLKQYRWMLRDVADGLAELVMERFAPTEQRFAQEPGRDPVTLYQRFAFLAGLISGETFEAAVHQILARPHRAWVVEAEERRPGQGFPATSAALRQLNRPGRRIEWPGGALQTLPVTVAVGRTVDTVDTPENRFVKFVLTYWRDFAVDVADALAREVPGSPVERGLREVEAVISRLDELLASDLFIGVQRMIQFPGGSQVLQKRAGYRDIFRAYVQFETAARLEWDGAEDVYGAGQRDVATLYEYWVFLKLAEVIGRLCGRTVDPGALFEGRPDGLGITLKRGRSNAIRGEIERLGRKLRIELWFNQTFSGRNRRYSSWTRPMRPDCSVRIQPVDGNGYRTDEVWLHFDAKYRVENLIALFGINPGTDEEEAALLQEEQQPEARLTPKRTDLLKMHAYRDAIRRSAGAYVIYPGDQAEAARMYHEILPGLGAFALRPTEGGEAEGAGPLQEFIDQVITHAASQATQHERTRYWTGLANRVETVTAKPRPTVPFLTRPPADTPVLLGYVRSDEQMAWIHSQRRYNLRADGRTGSVGINSQELAVEFVLLYRLEGMTPELWRVQGPPELYTHERMRRTGYPIGEGQAYFCLPLVPVAGPVPPLPLDVVLGLEERKRKGRPGSPVVVTWLDLLELTREEEQV